MDDLAIWILDWDEVGIAKLKEQFESWYPKAHIFTYCNRNNHETVNMNHAVLESIRMGFKYYHMANADVVYQYKETIPALYELVLKGDVAMSHAYTEGELANPNAMPYDDYLQDATSLTHKLELVDRFTGEPWLPLYDESFLGTGYSDLDLGHMVRRKTGLKIINDPRYAVKHLKGNTKRRDQKSFLKALERRNRLILCAKWTVVGIENWRGVEAYNETVPVEKRIPSLNELSNYTDEELGVIWRSVSPEHDVIFKRNGMVDPNTVWMNPILVGYDTRAKFKEEFGYD